MDGFLNINKPGGQTSFSIVAMVKRLSGEKRVGHAGTLDPDASGVLPVCLGKGTRVVEFLVDTTKTYCARIEMGITTDTYDASGKVLQRGDFSGITREKLESALDSFRGAIQQVPPMYSALKHHGLPLYKLARAGVEVERKSRPAQIHRLELMDWEPPLADIEVECSKGTYIRSLAHDLGQALGCGACLKTLVRTRCGIFDIKDAISLPQLEEAFRHGYGEHFIYPLDAVLGNFKAMVVDDAAAETIKRGGVITLGESDNPAENTAVSRCRAYTLDGQLLAILRHDPERNAWQPEKVLL